MNNILVVILIGLFFSPYIVGLVTNPKETLRGVRNEVRLIVLNFKVNLIIARCKKSGIEPPQDILILRDRLRDMM